MPVIVNRNTVETESGETFSEWRVVVNNLITDVVYPTREVARAAAKALNGTPVQTVVKGIYKA